ncbi:hypothetical protein [Magnetofaba australis]|uniref:hypothetical protein n=1 Tax=Magnetofaba australis TaxID=1472297 RepID=UPI000A19F3BD|nr:hypothetical protein [Magnetofaba australis]
MLSSDVKRLSPVVLSGEAVAQAAEANGSAAWRQARGVLVKVLAAVYLGLAFGVMLILFGHALSFLTT